MQYTFTNVLRSMLNFITKRGYMIATWTILNIFDNILRIKKKELAHALSFLLDFPMKVERIQKMLRY